MEENKISPYQIIGFFLVALIMVWMLSKQKPTETKPETNENKVEQSITPNASTEPINDSTPNPVSENDSIEKIALQNTYGVFSTILVSKDTSKVTLENDKIFAEINPKGGQLTTVKLKEFTNFKNQPVYLINRNNSFNLTFSTFDGRVLNTEDFYFTATHNNTQQGDQEIILKATISPSQYISFIYTISKNSYIVDFSIESEGISSLISSRQNPSFEWKTKSFRNSKSPEYENRYTQLIAGRKNDKRKTLSETRDDEEVVENVSWISYKQHFFSAILIPERAIDQTTLNSKNLVQKSDKEQLYMKEYLSSIPVLYKRNEFSESFKFYFGPTDYKILKSFKLGLEENISFGWGIFGWLNKFVFTPLFGFLSSFLPFGIAIILMTLIVRTVMSPVTYKSYVAQIKMKVLRPEIEEINTKYKNNAAKRQQETMALYTKAGVNPMAGCIPALLQLPVFYALFLFFPTAFILRQKKFLWADDLASYDVIAQLPFNIPFYGDHISLFPILASIAIFIYTMMTMGQQTATQQPGMPNMKFLMYISPLFMLFFFNNYASGLSLYYFISNLLTIFLMLIIKKYIVSEEKIHLKIQENKKKPKKGKFSSRLQTMMEEAQKNNQANLKKKKR